MNLEEEFEGFVIPDILGTISHADKLQELEGMGYEYDAENDIVYEGVVKFPDELIKEGKDMVYIPAKGKGIKQESQIVFNGNSSTGPFKESGKMMLGYFATLDGKGQSGLRAISYYELENGMSFYCETQGTFLSSNFKYYNMWAERPLLQRLK